MRNLKFFFTIIFLVLLLLCCESIFKKDISTIAPVAYYNTDELIYSLENDDGFQQNEIVAVTGFVTETNSKNGKFTILITGNTNHNHYIICEMNSSFEKSKFNFSEGDSVTIKGVLIGYLNDAVLMNCVLENILENE